MTDINRRCLHVLVSTEPSANNYNSNKQEKIKCDPLTILSWERTTTTSGRGPGRSPSDPPSTESQQNTLGKP